MSGSAQSGDGRLATIVEFTRPFTLLPPAVGFVCWGLVGWASPPRQPGLDELAPYLLLGALLAASLNVASNGLNQIADRHIDAINKPYRPLPSGRLSTAAAWAVTGGGYGVALAAASAITPSGRHDTFWVVLAGAIATWAYSGPPLRTKRFLWLANATVALPRGLLLVVAGWSVAEGVRQPEPWLVGGVWGLFLLGAVTTKDFADVEGDRAHGVETLPIRFGAERSARLIAPLFVLPFLLLPLAAALGWLSATAWAMAAVGVGLATYGGFIARLIVADPTALELERNHPSWRHMYLLMMVGQVGCLAAYLV